MVTHTHYSPMKSKKNNLESSYDSNDSGDPTTKLHLKIKTLKHNFIGNYVGRALVKHSNKMSLEYKDIVVVNKDEDIISILDEIYETFHPQLATTWLGITRTIIDDEVQHYKLWVNLNETTIGKHLFQLRAIKASKECIQLQLRVLNGFENSLNTTRWNNDSFSSFDMKEMSTYHNLCEIAKFSVILIMSIITICGNILWYCADYSLKLMGELTKLIQVLTPVIFGILDFMFKCVGGFYWLIYMMWHGNSNRLQPRLSSYVAGSRIPPLAIMPSTALPQREKFHEQPQSYTNYKNSYSQ